MANFVWRATGGAFGSASNWIDTTTNDNPALTPPGVGDFAIFDTTGGTVTGTGSVYQIFVGLGASTPWTFTGSVTTQAGSISSPVEFSAGATLTVTGVANAPYLPYGVNFDAPTIFDKSALASAAATLTVGVPYAPLDTAGASLTFQDGSTGAALGAAIGQGATGTLAVTGGSTFSTVANAALNSTSGGSGYLVIGSQATSNNVTTVGDGALVVTSSGTVDVGSGLTVGLDQGSVGSVTIATGGTVSAQGGYTFIGNGGGSVGSMVISSGGTFALGANTITIGNHAGSVGSLTVSSGGTFTVTEAPQTASYLLNIGLSAASGGFANASGTVTVTGSGALLNTNDNPVAVGQSGTGTLNVLSGGTVSAGTTNNVNAAALSLGRAGSATVNVAGTGSLLAVSGTVYAGRAGQAVINVTSGGSLIDTPLSATDAFEIGYGSPINGVFADGGSASLNIATGGLVSAGAELLVGYNGDSGSAIVSSGTLAVGGVFALGGGSTVSGGQGYLTVGAGGLVENTGSAITSAFELTAGQSAGETGTILVSGSGAIVNEGLNAARIGDYGSGSLTVVSGGTFDAASADSNLLVAFVVGQSAGGSGTVLLSGPGSTISAAGYTDFAEGGNATVTIEDGAVFTGGQVSSGAAQAEAVVIGGGNATSNSETGSANTPNFGGSATVEVTSDGTLSSMAGIRVGYRGDSGTLVVDSGSLVQAAGSIRAGTAIDASGTGRPGGSGSILVQGGSTLRSTAPSGAGSGSVILGDAPGTSGSLTVTGSGSLLDAGGGRIDVGLGGSGTLVVSNGATASAGVSAYTDTEAGFSIGASGGTGAALVTGAGSLLSVAGAITVAGGLLSSGGGVDSLAVSAGGTVMATGLTLWSGGSVSIGSASLLQISGAVINSGALTDDGTLVVSGSITGPGTLTVMSGSIVSVTGSLASQSVTFTGSGGTLDLGSVMGSVTVSQIEAGDVIRLTGVTGGSFAGDTLTTSTGAITFASFVGGATPVFVANGSGGVEVSVACYCAGTAILTETGERPVEDLAPGDIIITVSGEARPIRWIGRRGYGARFVARNPALRPIRFRAGSLGDGLPRRDLLVSPEHAMLLDGLLIPARHLVNGTTIAADAACGAVMYYHVELDQHDAILAEGAASETFLDDDSRGVFHTASGVAAGGQMTYCAPRVSDGFALEAVRRRLGARQSAAF